MTQITEHKLLELYTDTLNRCGVYLYHENDETIAYNIYEEFDVGVHSFFHIDNLYRLYDANLISIKKLNMSALLRTKVVDLQRSEEWSIEKFRISEKWKEIVQLADQIKVIN